MARRKSHREVLQDIADDATDEEEVPEVAFAAYVYEERSDFHHTVDSDGDTGDTADIEAVLDALSTHIAVVSEATGYPAEEIVEVVGPAAAGKRRE